MRERIKVARSRALDPFEIKLKLRLISYLIKGKKCFLGFWYLMKIKKIENQEKP